MRRFISLLLATVMVAAIAAGAAVNIAAKAAPGDCNGDGFYDNKDVVVLFRYLSGGTSAIVLENCDFNGDGEINNKDVVALFRALSAGTLPHEVENSGEEDEPTGSSTEEEVTTAPEEPPVTDPDDETKEPEDDTTEPWVDTDPWEPESERETEGWPDDTDTEEPATEDPWWTEPVTEDPWETEDVDEIEEIKEGEVKTAVIRPTNNYAYFKFTPEEDGIYTFYSISDSDTYGCIYDICMYELASNDDYDDNDFKIDYNMTAGTTYILGARYCNIDNKGSYNITIVKAAAATAIGFVDNGLSGYVDDGLSIKIRPEPGYAAVDGLSFTSSDPSVVSVTGNYNLWCYVRLNSPGTATITATTASGLTAACEITVKVRPEISSVYLSEEKINRAVGECISLYLYCKPDGACISGETIWTSSNESVVAINEYYGTWCNIQLISEGTATITATTESGFTSTCEITVTEPATIYEDVPARVEITDNESQYVYFTPEEDGEYIFFVSDYSNRNRVYLEIYSSNSWMNSCYEKVSAKLTAGNRYRICLYYFDCYDSESGYFNVTVKKAAPASELVFISDPEIEMYVDYGRTIYVKFEPWDAFEETITWISSDESVVRTNYTGHTIYSGDHEPFIYCNIIALSEGTATITAMTASGLTATCEVTVMARPAITYLWVSEQVTGYVGESTWISRDYRPYDASEREIVWTSSDESVATVSENGTVYCITEGTATITATTANGLTATCEFISAVRPALEGIHFEQNQINAYVGDWFDIYIEREPYNAAYEDVVWTSSDEGVVVIEDWGRTWCSIHLLSTGTVTITATTASGFTATCEIVSTIRPALTAIYLNEEQISDYSDNGYELCVSYEPYGAYHERVTWTSSDESIVMITGYGYDWCDITLVSEGTATITATTESGLTAACEVTVTARPAITYLWISEQVTGYVGESVYIGYDYRPYNASGSEIVWTSSDESVVTVSEYGNFYCISEGTATVTATTANGITATCVVTSVIRPALEGIYFAYDCVKGYAGDWYDLYIEREPYNAVYEDIVWTSSDENVVAINDCDNSWCRIYLATEGTATITAASESGFTATCTVTVSVPVIIEEETLYTVEITDNNSSQFTFTPDESGEYVFCTDNYSGSFGINLRIYDQFESYITNLSMPKDAVWLEGGQTYKIKIRLSWWSGSPNFTLDFRVGKRVQETGIEFNEGSVTEMHEDTDKILSISFTPWNCITDDRICQITSSDESVIYIDGWGSEGGFVYVNIYAYSLGTAVLTATSENGFTAAITVNVTPRPAATAIYVDEEATGYANSYRNIYASFEPDDAVFEEISWKSSDESVVQVAYWSDTRCRVFLVSEGTATVTATSENGFTASCVVTVIPRPALEAIYVENESVTGYVGSYRYNYLYYEPGDALLGEITWTSSDESIVAFNYAEGSDCEIYLVSKGTATVTATSENGLTASFEVNVIPRPALEAIYMESESVTGYVGSYYNNYLYYEPGDALLGEITWTSSDEGIVVIDNSEDSWCCFRLVSEGTATVTATSENGLTASFEVEVMPRPAAAGIYLSRESITDYAGRYSYIYAWFEPEDAVYEEIIWTSSDESIVAFNYAEGNECEIYLVSKGTATITAATASGLTATCTVTVKDISDIESISLGEVKEVVIDNPGGYIYFAFTPEEDGEYIFYSATYEDTYGYIYDSNMNEISYDDDSYGSNFCIQYYLEAGETYILGARYYSSNRTGTFPVEIITPDMPMMEIPAEEPVEEPEEP